MTPEEILKGNILIAEFMGKTISNSGLGIVAPAGFDLFFNYHGSWDWLMPVVEKIENLYPHGYRFTISSTFVRVHTCKGGKHDNWDEYNCTVFEGKLKCTWHAVVEFIKWHKTL